MTKNTDQLPLPVPVKTLLSRLGANSLGDPLFVLIGWPWMFYRQMRRDRAFIRAGGMAYATLIALVPMLVLIYTVLGSTGVVQQNPEAISDLIFGTFLGEVPELRETLLPGLRQVNLGALSATGLVMLFFVAARLFLMVERAYCDIFGTPNTRKLSYRLLNFYFTLTAVPVVLSFTILGSVEFATGYDVLWLSNLTTSILQFVVLLASIRLFPCTYVRWSPACAGALTAWLLLEVGGRGFSSYVQWFASDDPLRLVYGALWVIPIFLLWLYLLWLFILLGVEVAAVIQNYESLMEAAVQEIAREGKLLNATHALTLMGCIAHGYTTNSGAIPTDSLSRATGLSSRDVHFICETLDKADLLADSDQGWLPARPPKNILLNEIVQAWNEKTAADNGNERILKEFMHSIAVSFEDNLADASLRWYGRRDDY